jgi:hypothetical protein
MLNYLLYIMSSGVKNFYICDGELKKYSLNVYITFDRKLRLERLNIIRKAHEKFYVLDQLKGVSRACALQSWLDAIICENKLSVWSLT